MDKIALLKSREQQARAQNQSALDFAGEILDEASFVESDGFYFAGNDLVDNGTLFGEGVVCGTGTVEGIPVCLFVQNYDVMKGGLSKGQADKIVKCMDNAERAGLPLICALHTAGARLGEGLRVLDGYARVIARFASLRGSVPLVTVVKGEVYGMLASFTELADFTFVMKDAKLATASPAVLTAKAGMVQTAEPFEAKALAARGTACRVCKDAKALAADLGKLLDLLAGGEPEVSEDDLNASASLLNKGYRAENVIAKVLDKNTFFELCAECGKELRTGLGRIGGRAVAAVLCGDQPAELTPDACRKFTDLNDFAANNGIPLVLFVNARGFAADVAHEKTVTTAMANVFDSMATTDNVKISVVCGEAVGSAYTAFVSKEMGVDYSFAWANASVALFSGEQGGELFYADEIKKSKNRDKAREEAAKKYAEIEGDVFAGVQSGSIDQIIEPAHTRQYILSVLASQFE